MLDYSFGRSPNGRCCQRGQRGQGITSRALVGGNKYSYLFVNPLAEGSHDEGLHIPYAGAAIFSPDSELHNPLAEEYSNGGGFESGSSPSCSPPGLMFSFLSLPEPCETEAEVVSPDIPRTPSAARKRLGRVLFRDNVMITDQHHKTQLTALTLAAITSGSAAHPDLKATETLRDQMDATGSYVCDCQADVSRHEGTPLDLLWLKEPAAKRPPSPDVPCAPCTPPLIVRENAVATPLLWQRREWVIPEQERQKVHLQQHDQRQEPPQQQHQQGEQASQQPALNRADQWLPLVPLQRSALQLQQQPQELVAAPLSTVIPPASATFTAAARSRSVLPPASNIMPATSHPSTSSAIVAAIPGLPDAAADSLVASARSNPPAAQVATAESGMTNSSDGARESASEGGYSADVDRGSRCISGSSNATGVISCWVVADGPKCSISGLAMTRAVIRQLGLLPPGLFASE